MNSTITITFNSIPDLDTVFAFSDSLTGINIIETFKVSRSNPFESKRHNTDTFVNAIYYTQAFNLDYNWTSLYTINAYIDNDDGLAKILIIANNALSQFTLGTNTTSGALTAVIDNAVINNFSIDSVTISEADSDVCNKVKITVNTIETADTINLPISQAVTTNPFVFEYNRSGLIKIQLSNGDIVDNNDIYVPKLLSVDFDLNVYQTPTTGNLEVFRIASQGSLVFEYSLNNVDWQTNRNFTNLDVNDYTLYIT